MRKCTEKNTGKEYAVKIIDISGEKSDTYQAEQTKRDTIREINILRLCTGHPQISKCMKYQSICATINLPPPPQTKLSGYIGFALSVRLSIFLTSATPPK